MKVMEEKNSCRCTPSMDGTGAEEARGLSSSNGYTTYAPSGFQPTIPEAKSVKLSKIYRVKKIRNM
jgi:hypothetical protein